MEIRQRPFASGGLVRDWLAGDPAAARFFPEDPASQDGYRRRARAVDGVFAPFDRERAASVLEGGGPRGSERLRQFVEKEGYLVTTGQQPVLLGGPLYVIYKACSAIGLARRLEELLERPVLPVFWVASEDHDWDEARQTTVLDLQNTLRRVTLPPQDEGEPQPALHRIRPEADLLPGALRELLEYLPDSDFAPPLRELLDRAWAAGTDLPSAFQSTLDGLLGNHGLFLVQSHHPVIKEATRALLLHELERSSRSEQELSETVRNLEDAGYEAQVPILDRATNVFLDRPEGRERLLREGGDRFRLRRSGEIRTLEELSGPMGDGSTLLSPNVLLRPVVEASFFPTLAYVAGPGEAAYLAQTGPLFRAHGVERPVVHPRAALDLLESKILKVLEKHDLAADDLARPHHELAGRLVREEIPEEIRKEMGRLRGELARGTRDLGRAIRTVDATLESTVESVRSQGFTQLDEVERKLVQALKRENEITLAQVEKAQSHLFPGGTAQERVISPWYHLFRYGPDLLDRILTAARAALLIAPAPTGRPG
jgi:bacillithiol synthase